MYVTQTTIHPTSGYSVFYEMRDVILTVSTQTLQKLCVDESASTLHDLQQLLILLQLVGEAADVRHMEIIQYVCSTQFLE